MKILQKILYSQKGTLNRASYKALRLNVADLAMLLDGKVDQTFPWHR